MPSVFVDNINISDRKSKVTRLPCISSVIDTHTGPIIEQVPVNSVSEFDAYFPNCRERRSYVDLINEGNLLLLSRFFRREDREDRNTANLFVGKPSKDRPYGALVRNKNLGDLGSVVDDGTSSIIRWELDPTDKAYSEESTITDDIYSGRLSYSFEIKLPTNTNKPYYFTLTGTKGKYTNVVTMFVARRGRSIDSIMKGLTVRQDQRVYIELPDNPSVNDLHNNITKAVENDRDLSYVKKTSSSVIVYYRKPVRVTTLTSTDNCLTINHEHNDYRIVRPFFNNVGGEWVFNGFCQIRAKYPGDYHRNTLVSFNSPSRGMLEVQISCDSYSETFIGDILSTSTKYIVELVNRNSKLVSIMIPLLGGAGDETTEESINKIHNELAEICKVIDNRKYYLINNCTLTEDTPGIYIREAVQGINEYDYSIFALLDGLSTRSEFTSEQYKVYTEEFLARKTNLRAFGLLNDIGLPIKVGSEYVTKSEAIVFLGEVLTIDREPVLTALPYLIEVSNQDMLGIVDYNIYNPTKAPYKPLEYNMYRRSKDGNLAELIVDANGTYVTPTLWSRRITKTIDNYLRDLIPKVTRTDVTDILNSVKREFEYIDELKISSYNSNNGTLALAINLTSVRLNIINRKLNISIT